MLTKVVSSLRRDSPAGFSRRVAAAIRRRLLRRREKGQAPVIRPKLEPVPESLRQRLGPMTPPRERVFVGDGDFLETGFRFLRVFKEVGGLESHHRVLEVGCGIGRMAVALTEHLSLAGRYDGFDIVPAGIEWCEQRIAARHSNFRFQLVDLHNSFYNPGGVLQADTFEFPYADRSFDFVFLTSIFTHLLPEAVDRYLGEIRRVLAENGRCLMTVFLLNDDSRSLIARGLSSQLPGRDYGNHAVASEQTPESAVFHEERYFWQLVERNGLRAARPALYGTWCGRPDGYEYQDVVVLVVGRERTESPHRTTAVS